MKKIFIIATLFLFISSLMANDEKIELQGSILRGLSFSDVFVDARVFTELAKDFDNELTFDIKSWGTIIKPFDFVSLGIGNFSLSGVWSRFNNPVPSNLNALKEPLSVGKRLLINLPTSTSSSDDIFASVSFDFPYFQLDGFIEGFEKSFSASVGLSFKYETHDPKKFKIIASSAWNRVKVLSKTTESWFLEKSFFPSQFVNSLIQEIALRFCSNTLFLSGGVAQQPGNKFAYFFRTEYSLEILPFLLHMQVFLSSKEYITSSSSYCTSPFKASINPQLRFSFSDCFLEELSFGFAINAEVKNAKTYYLPMFWCFDYRTSVRFICNTISVLFDTKYSNPLLETTITLNIKPNYGFERTWLLDLEYAKDIFDTIDYGKLFVNSDFSSDFSINGIDITNKVFCDSEIPVNNIKDSIIDVGLCFSSDLKSTFFERKQNLLLKGTVNCELTKKKPAKITADFFVIVNLDSF